MSIVGKRRPDQAVSSWQADPGERRSFLGAVLRDIAALVGEQRGPKGDAMILVTKKDGTTTALNVDRIERVEPNNVSQGRESNVVLVGGGHLVVEETLEAVLDQIVEAKARVVARSFVLSDREPNLAREPAGPALRVVQTKGDRARGDQE
jgi:uncharacterized protein YlzI (FlbEa/FlbD family)